METMPTEPQTWWLELWNTTAYPQIRHRVQAPIVASFEPPRRFEFSHLQVSDMVLILEGMTLVYVWKNRWGDQDTLVNVTPLCLDELQKRSFVCMSRFDKRLVPEQRVVLLTSVNWVMSENNARM